MIDYPAFCLKASK